jgi:hypothetical protein
MKVVIPFVQIEAHNPNLQSKNRYSQIDAYYRCIVVSFASFRRRNPSLKLQLTTNSLPAEPFASQLEKLHVEIKIVSYAHNPPEEFGDTFRGCFYLFDAINAEMGDALYVDPDVFCTRPITQSQIIGENIGALDLGFDSTKQINGISPDEAKEIYTSLTGLQSPASHKHYGGEAIFIPKGLIGRLQSDIRNLWNLNLIASRNGQRFLPTEEHLLSLIFANYQVRNLATSILRIWTTVRYTEVEGGKRSEIFKICLWHLPAEKSFGFKTAYRLLNKNKLFSENTDNLEIERFIRIFNLNRSRYARLFIRYFT